MKKRFALLLFGLAGLATMIGCSNKEEVKPSTTTSNSPITTTSNDPKTSTMTTTSSPEEQVYDIYLMAQASGYTGTYEEWLDSIKGEKGDKGDKGDTGEKGDAGANGMSAYEIYCKYYEYDGTEKDWIDDLVSGKLGTKLVISFDTDGGSTVDSIEVQYKTKATAPAEPTKTGFKFEGWEYNDETIDFATYVFSSSITLKAQWTDIRTSADSLLLNEKEDGTYEVVGLKDQHDTSIFIPNEYNGKDITSIAAKSFKNGNDITFIKIGDKVKSISKGAFYGCSSLAEMSIPALMGYFGILFGEEQFENSIACIKNDIGYYVPKSLVKVEIRDEKISGTYNFENCSRIEEIILPESYIEIGKNMFKGCSSLKIFTLPSKTTSIGNYAFQGCSSLETLILPESVNTIGGYAFENCLKLKELTIPNNVKKIEFRTFNGCTKLESISLPDSIEVIASYAFMNCEALKDIVIPSKVLKIETSTFNHCISLESITLPNGLISIGDWAFYECSSLKEINIPETVSSIGKGVWQYCRSLSKINLPSNITHIYDRLLGDCQSLKTIIIPSEVERIEEYAFYGCSIEEITIPVSVERIDKCVFSGCQSLNNIYYLGTREQWSKITKDETWTSTYSPIPATVIHCTDGDVDISS